MRALLLCFLTLAISACASRIECPPMDERALARAVVDELVGAPREDTDTERAARAARGGSDDELALLRIGSGVTVPFDDLPRRGPRDAAVNLVVVSDFQCPYCARYADVLDRVAREHSETVAIYFVNFPLPFHEHARLAAAAAIEARVQAGDEGFFRMHDRLFAHQDDLTLEDLLGHAEALGLDVDSMRSALEDGRHDDVIARDMRLATTLGITGTPTTYIGSHEIEGAVPYADLEDAIDAAGD